MSAAPGHARGIALAIAAMVVFASQDGLTKHLAQTYAVAQILWVRYAFFALFALWMTRSAGPRESLRSASPALQILRSVLLVAEIGMFVLAIRWLPLADTHAIMALTPLLVTALSVPLLGERVGLRRWSAVGVGFAGMLLILRPGMGALHPAAFFALGSAAMYACYIALTRKVSLADHSGTTLIYTALVGAAVMTLIGPFHWQWPDASGWAFLLTLAVTGATGHFLFIKALEAAPASVLQPFGYTVLVWATIIGYVFFGNLPDAPTVAGALVIVASGLYTIHREHVRSAADAPSA